MLIDGHAFGRERRGVFSRVSVPELDSLYIGVRVLGAVWFETPLGGGATGQNAQKGVDGSEA